MRDDDLRLVLIKLTTICAICAKASLAAAYPIVKREYIEDLDEQLKDSTKVITEVLGGTYGGD